MPLPRLMHAPGCRPNAGFGIVEFGEGGIEVRIYSTGHQDSTVPAIRLSKVNVPARIQARNQSPSHCASIVSTDTVRFDSYRRRNRSHGAGPDPPHR